MKRLEVNIFGRDVYQDPRRFARSNLSKLALESPDPIRDIEELRRTGKTHQGLMLAISKALNRAEEKVVVLSNSIMESDRKLNYAMKILEESFPEDYGKWTTRQTSPKYMIRFSNGSSIMFEHMKTIDHVHSECIVIDDTHEAADVALMVRSSRNTAKEFIVTKKIIKEIIK